MLLVSPLRRGKSPVQGEVQLNSKRSIFFPPQLECAIRAERELVLLKAKAKERQVLVVVHRWGSDQSGLRVVSGLHARRLLILELIVVKS